MIISNIIQLGVLFLSLFLLARDVVKMLAHHNVHSLLDFNWTSQLRYYMRESNVYVSMITTELAYGYEYLGNTGRLVITPLTDRCYRFSYFFFLSNIS